MVRRVLWLSLLLVPADIAAAAAGVAESTLFLLSAIALVPLAWIIGESTERVGEHTGPAVAGLLNASFGNAPELMISLFAVHKGLFDVVLGSLAGSIFGNLLLVLGFSLMVGGRGRVNSRTAALSLGQVALAVLLFLVPSAAHWAGARDGLLGRYTFAPMALLLALYVVVTVLSTRHEHRRHRRALDEGAVVGADWPLPQALLALGLATVATVVVTEILTRTIEHFADDTGLDRLFVAAIIVAIVGNAAEHGGAVVVAARGNVELAAEIALSSAAQVALFVIPAVLFASLAMRPLPLAFTWTEMVSLGVGVLAPAALLASGRTAPWQGWSLSALYAGIAVMFWAVA